MTGSIIYLMGWYNDAEKNQYLSGILGLKQISLKWYNVGEKN